jgi:hypothetical protein
MAFTPMQLGGQDLQSNPRSEDGMHLAPSLHHNFSNGRSVQPHNGNDNQRLDQLLLPWFLQQPAFIDPGRQVTQTAPPFRAAQSHVSSYRLYHTDSRVNEEQTSSVHGFNSVSGTARAGQEPVNPEFLMVNKPSHICQALD